MTSIQSAFSNSVQSLLKLLMKFNWERFFSLVFILVSPFLVFYNLELNPRPWHDEGSSLSIARTLAEDGIYAIRSSDGYQTFGGVQSVGPTVILPVALAFKLFGVGLLQGRIVSACYALLTLWIFFLVAYRLFDIKVALVSVGFLLGSPAVSFLFYGRQVLGEVPALGFFLGGWLAWAHGIEIKKNHFHVISGILLGLAIITKSIYLFLGIGTIMATAILNLMYYRQPVYKSLIFIAIVAILCNLIWILWQVNYYGLEVYRENTAKLNQLADVTAGFNFSSTVTAFRYLFGTGSGHFFFFWGWPALIYSIAFSLERNRDGLTLAFLNVFVTLCLFYYAAFIIPWSRYAFPATAIVAMFVGKLYFEVARNSFSKLSEMSALDFQKASQRIKDPFTLAIFASLVVMSLGLFYQLQETMRSDVFDKLGAQDVAVKAPSQFSAPGEVADFLIKNVPEDAVIETWERELSVMTNHQYHYPDQILLARAHAYNYRGGDANYLLGEDYFMKAKPSYLVIGWFARFTNIYDVKFVNKFSHLVATFGDGDWRYDVYKMDLTE